MNDASATSHDGGSSWTVDSLGIGGPLDHYCVIYFLTEIKSSNCILLRPRARPEAIERKRSVQSIEAWVGRRSGKDTTGALGSSNDVPSV